MCLPYGNLWQNEAFCAHSRSSYLSLFSSFSFPTYSLSPFLSVSLSLFFFPCVCVSSTVKRTATTPQNIYLSFLSLFLSLYIHTHTHTLTYTHALICFSSCHFFLFLTVTFICFSTCHFYLFQHLSFFSVLSCQFFFFIQ